MDNRKLIVIADSHLGTNQGDVQQLIRFLSTLPPSRTELLFLGDLFHIWAGPEKFHTASVRTLFRFLQEFRSQKGLCYLVTGNRDVFITEKSSDRESGALPFDRIAVDALTLNRRSGRLLAVHGDTVNSRDKNYLRWRKTIRHPLFQLPFRLIPSRRARQIMFSLEKKLKHTNLAFRRDFPEEEWMLFLKAMQRTRSPDLVIAGHFHPQHPIVTKVETTTGIVVPDWCDNLFYLVIHDDLTYREKRFSEN